MALGLSGLRLWTCLTAAALAYGALVLALGVAPAPQRRQHIPARLAALNSLIAPLAVVGVAFVAASTTVAVETDARVHRYAWLPLWLAAAVTAALIAWIGVSLRRAESEAQVRRLERRVVLLLTGSVCVFLVTSTLPGALGPVEMFHEGESLVAARLTRAGYFPCAT